ncbi:MAG: glycosyltransferase family 2 protein [Geobacter sp.]|nr:MAG: glycosyltransferase family 2 protein [Geobacter sp.]
MCKASIIIVNWNGIKYLPECLEAVMRQTFTDFEVIVVDNGSTDESVNFIRDHYQNVRMVCLDENRGFTGGNCVGFEIAKGQFIALLNNDTRVEPTWLESLVSAMQANPGVGICASKIIIDGMALIDSVGDLFTTAFSGTKMGYLHSVDSFDIPHELHGGCAAAILYRRRMLDEIGFLDDDFFFNHEDTDLNMRAWLNGWKCEYVPEAIVHHKVSATVGALSDTSVYYFARNNVWVWIKNVPSCFILRYLPQRIVFELSSLAYFCIMKGKWGPFLKGKLDAVKIIPTVLKKRKEVQKLVRLSRYEIEAGLLPIGKYLRLRLQKIK